MKEPLIWVNEWFRERAMDQGLGFRAKVWQSGFKGLGKVDSPPSNSDYKG